jgi:3-dehydroquinate synthase
VYTLEVKLEDRYYPVYIKEGLMDSIGEEIRKIYKNKKIAIITDTNVEELYGKKIENSLQEVGYLTKKIIVEPGEKSKSFEILQGVCDELLEFKITRGDLIVALGGGVVGDLAGFAASIVLRGIPYIQVPTSLLAQIDSSVGGKVAINTSRGKNLVGSFYHPAAVFIDPGVLKTLSERYLYDGMAEVIKYGVIRDEDLFNELLRYGTKDELINNLESIIYRCCSIKADIVERDERDTGERMLLNFGHTIGHGIEKYFDYEEYTHGEGVALGMYAITRNSEKLGITKAGTSSLLKDILIKYNLPWQLPDMDKNEIMNLVGLDKKNTGKGLNLIMLKEIGSGFVVRINPEEIDKYISI